MTGVESRWIHPDEFRDEAVPWEEASLYQTAVWRRFIDAGFGIETRLLLTESSTDGPIAVMPVMVFSRGGLKLYGSPLRGTLTEHAGPRFVRGCPDRLRVAAFKSQLRLMNQTRVLYSEVGIGDADPTSCTGQALASCGYRRSARRSLCVDLSGGAAVAWKALQGRARTAVRKAERLGVTVREFGPGTTDAGAYYRLLAATFERHGRRSPHPPQAFQAIVDVLIPAGVAKGLLAEHAGSVVAGAVFLQFNGRMVYLSGASSEQAARTEASTLIQWRAMESACATRHMTYDLGGTGIERIDRFKESFGGVPVEFSRWVRVPWYFRPIVQLATGAVSAGWTRPFSQ